MRLLGAAASKELQYSSLEKPKAEIGVLVASQESYWRMEAMRRSSTSIRPYLDSEHVSETTTTTTTVITTTATTNDADYMWSIA